MFLLRTLYPSKPAREHLYSTIKRWTSVTPNTINKRQKVPPSIIKIRVKNYKRAKQSPSLPPSLWNQAWYVKAKSAKVNWNCTNTPDLSTSVQAWNYTELLESGCCEWPPQGHTDNTKSSLAALNTDHDHSALCLLLLHFAPSIPRVEHFLFSLQPVPDLSANSQKSIFPKCWLSIMSLQSKSVGAGGAPAGSDQCDPKAD